MPGFGLLNLCENHFHPLWEIKIGNHGTWVILMFTRLSGLAGRVYQVGVAVVGFSVPLLNILLLISQRFGYCGEITGVLKPQHCVKMCLCGRSILAYVLVMQDSRIFFWTQRTLNAVR